MQLRDCAFLFAALLSGAALAAEPAPRYNVVSLQASAQREIPNDLANPTLAVEVNDATPAKVADAVNRSLNDALRVAKQFPSVRASSGNSGSFPIYTRDNQLQGWRGRGELRLESEDFAALPELIGRLQGSLQLGSLQFSVSPQARRAAENALISEAIAAFKARADIIRTALGGRGYKLQSLDVSSGHRPPPVPRVAMAQTMASSAPVAPPELEAGLSTITVSASGTIEVLE